MGGESKLGMKIPDIFPRVILDTPDGKNIPVSIRTVGGEDPLPMRFFTIGYNGYERFSINPDRCGTFCRLDQSRKQVNPADHGLGGRTLLHLSRPLNDERDPDSSIVTIPLGQGPLGPVIGGENKNSIFAK